VHQARSVNYGCQYKDSIWKRMAYCCYLVTEKRKRWRNMQV
jgi:hypothetical protein